MCFLMAGTLWADTGRLPVHLRCIEGLGNFLEPLKPQGGTLWGYHESTLCSLFLSRVTAENDFLHSLLGKVTASKGDSGGQGTVPAGQTGWTWLQLGLPWFYSNQIKPLDSGRHSLPSRQAIVKSGILWSTEMEISTQETEGRPVLVLEGREELVHPDSLLCVRHWNVSLFASLLPTVL